MEYLNFSPIWFYDRVEAKDDGNKWHFTVFYYFMDQNNHKDQRRVTYKFDNIVKGDVPKVLKPFLISNLDVELFEKNKRFLGQKFWQANFFFPSLIYQENLIQADLFIRNYYPDYDARNETLESIRKSKAGQQAEMDEEIKSHNRMEDFKNDILGFPPDSIFHKDPLLWHMDTEEKARPTVMKDLENLTSGRMARLDPPMGLPKSIHTKHKAHQNDSLMQGAKKIHTAVVERTKVIKREKEVKQVVRVEKEKVKQWRQAKTLEKRKETNK